ncbi:hypothetical protein [Caenimonas sp. SL110]|uniref:hypothetical protein n=1 Tax=Caenimonas sp. SL110 TaxID=1450524 RepID=UPI00069E3584|nr:hypothetical protein [Caenimonas sp. SL110]
MIDNSALAFSTSVSSGIDSAPVFSLDAPGTWTSHQSNAEDYGSRVLVQPDGKIIIIGKIGGSPTSQVLVQRFNADGTLDLTFNAGATSIATLPANAFIQGAALDADGNILIAASAIRTANFNQFVLVRLTPEGALDTTFDSDSIALTQIGTRSDVPRTMLVQADGQIILAGSTQTDTSSLTRDFAFVRYNADGSLDTTFDTDGILTSASPGSSDAVTGMVELADGGFMAVATRAVTGVSNSVVLIKYNSNAAVDTTFGTDGMQTVAISATSSAFASNGLIAQDDGKFVVTGSEDRGLGDGSSTGFVMRFNANGTPDASFGTDGKVVVQLGTLIDQVLAVVQQDDGKLVVSGLSFYSGTSNHGFIARFNENGTLDTTFSTDGVAWSPFPSPADDAFQNLALQADGKIVVTGFRAHTGTPYPEDYDRVLLRYNADGTLDTTFNNAYSLGEAVSYTENAGAIVLDATAQVYDAELTAQDSYGGSTLTLSRHGGASADDVFGSSGEISLADGNVLIGATVVGTFSSGNGSISIQFAADTTQAQVNSVMSGLTYANTSDAPGTSVTIDWVFSDGNVAGGQGTGGVMSATGTTTIAISQTNDLLLGDVGISGAAVVGKRLTVDSSLSDADGLGAFSYQWLRGETPIPDANASTYTVKAADIGFQLRVTVSYVDGGGTSESETSSATVAVGIAVTPQPGTHEVIGTSGNDQLLSGRGRDDMIGGAGDDVYYVNQGGDTIFEEMNGGFDTVIAKTSYTLADNVENLTLTGDEDLRATGNELDNTITGNNGDNRIVGGLGADVLTGGQGEDKFMFLSTADSSGYKSIDVITDFSSEQADVIHLKTIDADPSRLGNQAFRFIGSDDFSATNAAGQVRFDPVTQTIYASTDADADAELAIQVVGVETLSSEDFVL